MREIRSSGSVGERGGNDPRYPEINQIIFINKPKAEVKMNPTNQISLALENELNNVPSALPINPNSTHKLTLFTPSGKVRSIFAFASITELRHFIELNQPPRYDVWA
jgi:hypothetical protein